LVSLVQKILAKNFLGSKKFFAKIYFRENRMQKVAIFSSHLDENHQFSAYEKLKSWFLYAESCHFSSHLDENHQFSAYGFRENKF